MGINDKEKLPDNVEQDSSDLHQQACDLLGLPRDYLTRGIHPPGRGKDNQPPPVTKSGILPEYVWQLPYEEKFEQHEAPAGQIERVPVNGVLDGRCPEMAGTPVHHYLPANLKEIEVNGVKGSADELRIQASQFFMEEQNGIKNGFASINNNTNSLEYAQRMAQVAAGALNLQEQALRQGVQGSPNNPYFCIYLSDTLVGQAMQSVIQDIKSGRNVNSNNPTTLKKIDEAIEQTRQAREVAARYGNTYVPSAQMMPLSPYALNPYFFNPDLYWGGALYQACQREVGLKVIRNLITSGALKFELPPNLPPR